MTTGRINQVAFILRCWHLPCLLNNQRGKDGHSGHPQQATNAFGAICMGHEQHFEAHLHQRWCKVRCETSKIKFHRIEYETQEPEILHKEHNASDAYY
ncbi:hypothetical protein RHGRI_014045 [Rhododendron griersonianum]|uniref:Uncharacterized protein n=1 Tax=Rhododendron griersonianum TaxID=479676 RepID=A0AAV6K7V3_9ERIC|nr:hypothetical protein RHGRI_014045 [Rhododendron griersonianum]